MIFLILQGTNEYDGMVGQLINQDVFMAAAPLTIIADRQMYVNFSKPFDMQPYTFMHARPKEKSKTMMFVDPFKPMVSSRTWLMTTPWTASLSVIWGPQVGSSHQMAL